jgi:hypothetical protein
MEDFRARFSDLPDPRAANARHDLMDARARGLVVQAVLPAKALVGA